MNKKTTDILTLKMIRKAVKILKANPVVCHFCKGRFTDYLCNYYLAHPLPICRRKKCNKKGQEMINFLMEDSKIQYGYTKIGGHDG